MNRASSCRVTFTSVSDATDRMYPRRGIGTRLRSVEFLSLPRFTKYQGIRTPIGKKSYRKPPDRELDGFIGSQTVALIQLEF